MAPGRRRTASGRSIGAVVAGEDVNPQQTEVNGANLGNQAPASSSQHEVVTRDELNKMVDEINQKMESSQKALMDKLNALLTLQSNPAPRTMPEPAATIEQENSSVSGLHRRNGKQPQKRVTTGHNVEENVNTPLASR